MSYKDSKILFNKRECIVHKDKNNNLFIKSSGKQIDVNKLFHKNKQILKKQYEKFRIKKKVNGGLLYENINDKFNDLYLKYANSLKNHIFDTWFKNETKKKLGVNFVKALESYSDNKNYNIAFDVLILKRIYTNPSEDFGSYTDNFDSEDFGKKKIADDLIKIKQDLLIAFIGGFKNIKNMDQEISKLINKTKDQYDALTKDNNSDAYTEYKNLFNQYCKSYSSTSSTTDYLLNHLEPIDVNGSTDVVLQLGNIFTDAASDAVVTATNTLNDAVAAQGAAADLPTENTNKTDAIDKANEANRLALEAINVVATLAKVAADADKNANDAAKVAAAKNAIENALERVNKAADAVVTAKNAAGAGAGVGSAAPAPTPTVTELSAKIGAASTKVTAVESTVTTLTATVDNIPDSAAKTTANAAVEDAAAKVAAAKTTATNANTAVTDAVTKANTADSIAADDISTKNTAVSDANAAAKDAEKAVEDAEKAVNDAEMAVKDAEIAVTAAKGAIGAAGGRKKLNNKKTQIAKAKVKDKSKK
jgi:hypothetical protein